MANFTTFKNTLKKIESRQQAGEKVPGCGVIHDDEISLATVIDSQDIKQGVGYLLVPGKLSLAEWTEKHG